MKNRLIWQKEDLKAGRWIIRESSRTGTQDIGFATSVSYKLCWNPIGPKWCLVAMNDGMISKALSQEDMLKRLNEDKFGYRPMTHAEILNVVCYTQNQLEGE